MGSKRKREAGSDGKMGPTGWRVMCILLAALFLSGGGLLILDFRKATAARSWPTVTGQVQTSRVLEVKGRGAGHKMDVKYEYAVNGQTYTGNTFNTENNYIDKYDVPNLAQQYAAGKPCRVSYNPKAPDESVLVPGRTWQTWLSLFLGIALALVGIAAGVVAFFIRSSASTPEAVPDRKKRRTTKDADEDEEDDDDEPPRSKRRTRAAEDDDDDEDDRPRKRRRRDDD